MKIVFFFCYDLAHSMDMWCFFLFTVGGEDFEHSFTDPSAVHGQLRDKIVTPFTTNDKTFAK